MNARITQIWFGLTLLLAIVVKAGEFHELQFFFSPQLIMEEKQYWRIFTSALYFGRFSLSLVLHLSFEYQLSSCIEQRYFHGCALEYFIFLSLGCILIVYFRFLEWFSSPFLCPMIYSMICYIASRVIPDMEIMFFGIRISMRYAPLVDVCAVGAIGGLEKGKEQLLAYFIGHILWFFREVFPCITGLHPLRITV